MANVRGLNRRPVAAAAVAVLLGSTMAVALSGPATADLSTSGVWIFPHERQSAVLGGTLGQYFYNTTSGDDWIADAFFADAGTDSATVQADFYNPTGGDLSNVILWVAVSDDSLFTSIDFSGGSSGDMSVGVDDLGGGTPTTGASLPDFVYPAFYTSYGVGDIDSDGVVTVTLDVTGDFAGGLVLRLDYTATDASGGDVSGPFDAGMSVYEWGDLPADDEGGDNGNCGDASNFHLSGTLSQGNTSSEGIDIDASLELAADFEYEASDVTVTLTPGPGLTLLSVPGGSISQNIGALDIGALGGQAGNFSKDKITLRALPIAFDQDQFSITMNATGVHCSQDFTLGNRSSVTVRFNASGNPDTASTWARDLADAIRGSGHGHRQRHYNFSDYQGFMEGIALHSDVFTYGPWDGTDPLGGKDAGWIDISDLNDTLSILRKDGRGNGNLKEAEQELLALWLNVASGHTPLATNSTGGRGGWLIGSGGAGGSSGGELHHGHLIGLPNDVQGVINLAESALTNYTASQSSGNPRSHGHDDDEDDHGAEQSARALWGPTLLCWLVNAGWLRMA